MYKIVLDTLDVCPKGRYWEVTRFPEETSDDEGSQQVEMLGVLEVLQGTIYQGLWRYQGRAICSGMLACYWGIFHVCVGRL